MVFCSTGRSSISVWWMPSISVYRSASTPIPATSALSEKVVIWPSGFLTRQS